MPEPPRPLHTPDALDGGARDVSLPLPLRVVIVSWNCGPQLRGCLTALADAETDDLALDVVVVDNGSTDDSIELAHGAYPFRLIRNGRNEGFARAANQGAADAEQPFLLFLNPDTRVEPNALRVAAAFLASTAGVPYAVAGVKLVDEHGDAHRSSARFPTPWQLVARSFALDRLLPRVFPPLELLELDHLSSCDVDHVMGAFFLVRREAFVEAGGFDERFFLYLEDLDLSLRLAQRGWRTRFLAEAAVFHAKGGVSRQVLARRLAYWTHARVRYVAKHHGRFPACIVAAGALGVEPWIRAVHAAAGGRARGVVESFAGASFAALGLTIGDRVFRARRR